MITINDKPLKIINYPNGEFSIDFENNKKEFNKLDFLNEIIIDWKVENIYKEIIIINFIGKYFENAKNLVLNTNYLPFQRDDKNLEHSHISTLQYLLEDINKYYSKIIIPTFHPLIKDNITWQDKIIINETLLKNKFKEIISKLDNKKPILVFPDNSAKIRFGGLNSFIWSDCIIFDKERDYSTGQIIKHEMKDISYSTRNKLEKANHIIIIDDICSYGNTFINVAKKIKEINENANIILFTFYDENQTKSNEFNELINEHIYIDTINFKNLDNIECPKIDNCYPLPDRSF